MAAMMRTAQWMVSAGATLLVGLACQSSPQGPPDAAMATATATPSSVSSEATSATAPTSANAPPSASSAAGPAESCEERRKAVVHEVKQIASCDKDEDCKVHGTVLCALEELDCYAVHIRKDGNPEQLDAAVKAYADNCPMSKCKCDLPGKSVCREGLCSAED